METGFPVPGGFRSLACLIRAASCTRTLSASTCFAASVGARKVSKELCRHQHFVMTRLRASSDALLPDRAPGFPPLRIYTRMSSAAASFSMTAVNMSKGNFSSAHRK
ncbi:hypothetical protein BT69DRAFT_996889 [Atractiella rhizophila]|nr:hypothetical protein BT69DRAFT_996889 [Atractiella rhizophila]